MSTAIFIPTDLIGTSIITLSASLWFTSTTSLRSGITFGIMLLGTEALLIYGHILSAAAAGLCVITYALRVLSVQRAPRTHAPPQLTVAPDDIARLMLAAFHRAIEMRIYIEGSVPLSPRLASYVPLDAAWRQGVFDLLFQTQPKHEQLVIWLDQSNTIKGIRVQPAQGIDAIELTRNSDLLIIEGDLASRTCRVIACGAVTPPLTPASLAMYMKSVITTP